MADQEYSFTQARARLEDIVTHVRKKDVSLERSLDLLEEGVRLANTCTEHIDQSEWRSVVDEIEAEAEAAVTAGEEPDAVEYAGAATASDHVTDYGQDGDAEAEDHAGTSGEQ